MTIRLVAGLILLLSFVGGIQGQDDNPVIAILRWSDGGMQNRVIDGLFDLLVDYGLIGEQELSVAVPGQDFRGENITILWRDAGRDITLANAMIEEVLDEGAEILVTMMTIVSELAVKITAESGIEPTPLVIFSLVSAPYASDIAASPCDKPDHVVGTHSVQEYEVIMELLPLLDLDIQRIGTYVNDVMPNSVYAANQFAFQGQKHGYMTEVQPVVSMTDLAIATDLLLDNGADMIIISAECDEMASSASMIMEAASASGVPVMGLVPAYASLGVQIGAGFDAHYREGVVQGQLLVAALEGRLDAANIRIHSMPSTGVALNLDTMETTGIEVPTGLLDVADWLVINGESTQEFVKPPLTGFSIEERRAIDEAFIESLTCS